MSCLIDVDHDECYQELKHAIVKARKKFICCECGAPIHRGDLYDLFVGAIDDRIDTQRTCLVCESISKKILCSRPYGGMYEEIFNSIDAELDLHNCILMVINKDEFEKLCSQSVWFETFGEDEED